MARIRFTVGTRYLHNAQVFWIRKALVGQRLLVENQSFGGQTEISIADLCAAWGRGEIFFEAQGKHTQPPSDNSLAIEYTIADFQHLPGSLRDEAWRRYQLLLPLIKQPPSERCRSQILAYAETLRRIGEPRVRKRGAIGEAISWASLERWLKAFENSGYDIRSLVPAVDRSARKGEVRLNSEVEAIIQAVLAECAANPQQRTATDVYFTVVNRIAEENRMRPTDQHLIMPGSITIYRRIRTAGLERILSRQRSRLEKQATESVSKGPRPMRILERVEIDNTLIDLFVVDEEDRLPIGRPLLTYALDVYSGLPCGFYIGFEPASAFTASSCLYHCIMPKPDVRQIYETEHEWPVFGLMETLVTDNGKDFVNADLKEACAQFGVLLEQMPVRTPWFKGSVERFFRTNNTGLIHGLPGTSFSNILERGDYEVMQHACISLTAFWKILHIFLLDYYAQNWHSGKKCIPYKRWMENIQMGFLPVLHTSAEETRILLMRSETRTIQRTGIEFECLFYRGPELKRLRSQLQDGEKVRFKYDPADISHIYVSDPVERRWLRIPAADRNYTQGLSLWKHRIINRFVQAEKHEVNIAALAAAKAKIQKIVAEEYALTRKSRGRKTAARFLGVGVPDPPTPSTSLALPAPSLELPSSQPETEPPSLARSAEVASTNASTPLTPPIVGPGDDLDDLDLSGWGGYYQLP